jgi:hypothetical protein
MEADLYGYSSLLTSAWAFVASHPFVSAWLALASAWALFTVSSRDRA